ncbi:MAG TPA: DUF6599 family protein [Thermodesulfovibrionales bacterium]|nr:DUF6599 family protein [Thermodesulfovibrionales bacterium]
MNQVPLIYRILLIGLLPLIAAVLFFKGQSYDPALIDFRSVVRQEAPVSSGPLRSVREPLAPSSPGEITGFRQLGRPHTYTKENLYEHVNGHAEYFIGAGFMGLTVTEYIAVGSKATGAEIRTEVFDMGKNIQAFGVLADESGGNPAPVSVGVMGYKSSGGVNFIKGSYYVKISALDPKAPVLKFAKAFAETLPSGKDSFQVFAKLPDMGKVSNTRFIKEGYRGLDFLRNVIEREYSTGGRKITVALISGSEHEIRTVMSSFDRYFKKSGIPNEKLKRGGREVYKVTDKYEGTWFLIPGRDAVFAVFGTDDEEILRHIKEGGGRER